MADFTWPPPHASGPPVSATTSEDTSRDIADAKQAAEKANATANRVKDELNPIQQQLDRWKTQYADSNMTNKDLDTAFLEANKSGNPVEGVGSRQARGVILGKRVPAGLGLIQSQNTYAKTQFKVAKVTNHWSYTLQGRN